VKVSSILFCGIACLAFAAGCRKPAEPPQQQAQASSPASPPAASRLSQVAQARPSGPIRFIDITQQAGIRFKHNSGAFGQKYLPETMGSGVCVLDYDNDGWQDILFVNSKDWPGHRTHPSYPALYHNERNGTFKDVTEEAGLAVEMYGMGCAVGDYDDDGRDDIFITALDGSHLFHNEGGGKFVDITRKAGIRDGGFPTGAVWFDYDNDGKLDLYVSHYVDWSIATDQPCALDGAHKSYCTPELYKGQSGALFHNLGDGKFEDVTRKAGLYDATSKALGVTLLDYDGDGWVDLFVANDTQPNKLYRNNHDGTFSENALSAGVAYSDAGKARAGMGVDVADYDRSGRQGLIIGNFANESLALYHNDGDGLFSDKSVASGVASPSAKSLTFGTFFFDYDLDGLPDIFASNGHVADDISVIQPTIHYAEPMLLFRNRGAGKFEDMSEKMGPDLEQPIVARGAAYGDFDNDGDLDVVVSTNNGLAKLLRNENGNQNDVLRVKAVGVRSNRDAVGAKVTVITSGGQRLTQMVKGGSSYLSQSELPVTFGLGKPGTSGAVALQIVWPSGKRESFTDLKPNQVVTLQEGKGIVATQPIDFSGPAARAR
jgi:hypothetical protein